MPLWELSLHGDMERLRNLQKDVCQYTPTNIKSFPVFCRLRQLFGFLSIIFYFNSLLYWMLFLCLDIFDLSSLLIKVISRSLVTFMALRWFYEFDLWLHFFANKALSFWYLELFLPIVDILWKLHVFNLVFENYRHCLYFYICPFLMNYQ